MVEKSRETFQNLINNLIVEAGHKFLCDDATIFGLILAWNRFCNLI